jgi:hypothetical protein
MGAWTLSRSMLACPDMATLAAARQHVFCLRYPLFSAAVLCIDPATGHAHYRMLLRDVDLRSFQGAMFASVFLRNVAVHFTDWVNPLLKSRHAAGAAAAAAAGAAPVPPAGGGGRGGARGRGHGNVAGTDTAAGVRDDADAASDAAADDGGAAASGGVQLRTAAIGVLTLLRGALAGAVVPAAHALGAQVIERPLHIVRARLRARSAGVSHRAGSRRSMRRRRQRRRRCLPCAPARRSSR